jgi:hypothetical protein
MTSRSANQPKTEPVPPPSGAPAPAPRVAAPVAGPGPVDGVAVPSPPGLADGEPDVTAPSTGIF